jgi:hypothetical protein
MATERMIGHMLKRPLVQGESYPNDVEKRGFIPTNLTALSSNPLRCALSEPQRSPRSTIMGNGTPQMSSFSRMVPLLTPLP